MFLAFRICARPIFSENGKDIFLFGVLPSKYSGSAWGFNTDSGKRKTVFFGGRGFCFFSPDFSPPGGGWGGECGRDSNSPNFFCANTNSYMGLYLHIEE